VGRPQRDAPRRGLGIGITARREPWHKRLRFHSSRRSRDSTRSSRGPR
jgi:hypothetical protein